MTVEAHFFWLPELEKDIEQNVKDCTAGLATVENLNHGFPKKNTESQEHFLPPVQEVQTYFTRKLLIKHVNGESDKGSSISEEY